MIAMKEGAFEAAQRKILKIHVFRNVFSFSFSVFLSVTLAVTEAASPPLALKPPENQTDFI